MLRSDAHHDNVHNKWALEKHHLDKALEMDAPVLDFGDLFCAMQGKYDPRSDLSALKEEHRRVDYLDALVETAARDYAPYKQQFAVLGKGNHESSILNRLGTDLTNNLAHRLNSGAKNKLVYVGGYGGWVFLKFTVNKTKRQTLKLHYFHGSGGGGPVTRGVIQTNRMAVYTPDADIVVSGHTHDSWVVPVPRQRVSTNGAPFRDNQWHVRCGTYKDEYEDGHSGWHVETGKPPKVIGAVWMTLRVEQDSKGFKVIPSFEIAV